MSINEIKREYIKKGGNKYTNMIIIHAFLFIFVLVTFLFIGVPQTGKGFKDHFSKVININGIIRRSGLMKSEKNCSVCRMLSIGIFRANSFRLSGLIQ